MQPWLAKEMKHPKMRMYLFQSCSTHKSYKVHTSDCTTSENTKWTVLFSWGGNHSNSALLELFVLRLASDGISTKHKSWLNTDYWHITSK